MKKCFVCAAAVAVACAISASASAGEKAVSKSQLSSMGLAPMQQLADQDGLNVRGQGFHLPLFPIHFPTFPHLPHPPHPPVPPPFPGFPFPGAPFPHHH